MSQHHPGSIAARVLRLLLLFAAIPVALASLLSSALPDWWLGDLFTHFRIQYLTIGLALVIPAWWLRERWLGLAALIAIGLNVVPVIDYFAIEPPLARAAAPSAGERVHFRIAAANIFFRNRNFDAVARWIRDANADLVVLVEATPVWRDALRERLPEFGFMHLVARQGRSGKLLIARARPARLTALDAKRVRSPMPLVTLRKDGASLMVAGVHTEWPMGPERSANRNEELFDLARQMRASVEPMMAVGDFNITPFSPVFQTLLEKAHASRAAAGRGWMPTWPVFFPPAGIQIDQVVHSREIRITDLRTGAGLGSDHRWVLADLTVPARPAPTDQSAASSLAR
ncbi:MAG: endonuclease/exonuclease/phosphatase family protein [Burkholderiaceae bacterium]